MTKRRTAAATPTVADSYSLFLAALKKAHWKNSGICYGRAAFYSEDDAKAFSELVKADGRTANGGMFHGMPLGRIQPYRAKDDEPAYWEVTY